MSSAAGETVGKPHAGFLLLQPHGAPPVFHLQRRGSGLLVQALSRGRGKRGAWNSLQPVGAVRLALSGDLGRIKGDACSSLGP